MFMPNTRQRIYVLMIITFTMVANVSAQDCVVTKEELKGTYSGDCKKGKADGKGKAIGKDSYEGEFKGGTPEGKGLYTWSNGNEYRGEFQKGLKEGKGVLVLKRENKGDSILEGYWKKDTYVGKYEHPYRVINKSKLVTDLEVEYKIDPYNKITFFITNTSGGASLADGEELPKLKVDEIEAMTGGHGRLYVNDTHAKKTESILEDVRFPIRLKAKIGTEEVELEFREAGTYIVNIRIND
jgi:hypothetical protein